MNVLICLLGLAPGVATGAYYALARDWSVAIDRLVTLTTSHPQANDCEGEIAVELRRWRREKKVAVEYDGIAILPEPVQLNTRVERQTYRKKLVDQMVDACRLRIPYPDVNAEKEVAVFREAILALVRDVYQQDAVYLCLAGGRKSMAGIAAITTQLYGESIQGLYHLYVLPELEQDGMINVLGRLSLDQKQHVLRPEPSEVQLVEIPYLQVREINGRLQLALKGSLEGTTSEYLRQHSVFVEALDQQSAEKFWSYIFEEKVALYLERGPTRYKYTQAFPHFRIPNHERAGDVDVYAFWDHPQEQLRKVLVCECKLRLAATPDMSRLEEAIDQIVRLKRPAIKAYERKCQEQDNLRRQFEWWVVTNMRAISLEIETKAQQNGIQIHVATLPSNWQAGLDWEIPNVKSSIDG
jgi:CRISPR-associated protein (TIGR02584 family)